MNKLGLGLLANPQLPPDVGLLSMWMDPDAQIVSSGGLVDSWTSRAGGAVFTAATTTRPVAGSGYIEFDGVDDFMSRVADSQSHPVSQSRFTWAAWMWRASAGDRVLYSSVPLFTASGGILVQDSTASRQYYANNSGAWNKLTALPLATWVFRALVYDSTLPLGSRTTVYEGQTPGTVALVAPDADSSVGITGIAAGTSCIGRDADLGRYYAGRAASMYLYNGVVQTLPKLRALAAFKVPT